MKLESNEIEILEMKNCVNQIKKTKQNKKLS
jgi:hypothetical protein